MEKSVQMQAATVELATEKALVELGAKREDVEVEVIKKGGIFSKAEVKVTLKQNAASPLKDFIIGVLERMGLDCTVTAEQVNGNITVEIAGADSAKAIGYRGEVLDAFQYLSLTFLNERKLDFKKLVIDAENYRAKRAETLTALAVRLAQKAVRLRRKIALEPMNPFERRAIHSALADDPSVTTASEGEEPNRFVVIIPVGVDLKDPRPLKNGERERHDGRSRGRRNDQKRDRKPRAEEPEVEDGNVYRGYYTQSVSKAPAQAGPPKFKSFGGKKGRR